MAISEKKKNAALHTSMHELRKEGCGDSLLDFFDSHREELLSLCTDLAGEDSAERFKEALKRMMKFTHRACYETYVRPLQENEVRDLENVLTNIRNLRSDIAEGVINLDKIDSTKFEEWGGAGVIVTNDKNRPRGETDLFVCTRLAPVIVWLMIRLRDMGDAAWDWRKKYTYFGLIAEAAQHFITEYGDTDNRKHELAIYVLDHVTQTVEDWKKEASCRCKTHEVDEEEYEEETAET